jgi:multidrug efflux pump subunit AcrB
VSGPGPEPSDAEGGETGKTAGGGLSAVFIARPTATIMLMLGVLLVGLLAYAHLPIASLPTVNVPTVLVTAELSGADAETNASAVTTPLEKQFGQIPGLTQMTSSSADSYSQITLQFSLGRSVDGVAQVYRKTNPAATPVLILGLTSDTLPLTTVDDYGENILMQRLSQVSGVGLVTIGGQQQPAMRIEVNPAQLAGQGLTLEDVRNAVMAGTVDAAKGVLQGPQQAFAIAANDQLFRIPDYDDLVVAYRNGAPVMLSDVANVVDGLENSRVAGRYQGVPAVIVDVQRQPGANVIQTVQRVRAELPRLQQAMPWLARLL